MDSCLKDNGKQKKDDEKSPNGFENMAVFVFENSITMRNTALNMDIFIYQPCLVDQKFTKYSLNTSATQKMSSFLHII